MCWKTTFTSGAPVVLRRSHLTEFPPAPSGQKPWNPRARWPAQLVIVAPLTSFTVFSRQSTSTCWLDGMEPVILKALPVVTLVTVTGVFRVGMSTVVAVTEDQNG